MRKIIFMALAAFLWKQVKARIAPPAGPMTAGQGPSRTYAGRR